MFVGFEVPHFSSSIRRQPGDPWTTGLKMMRRLLLWRKCEKLGISMRPLGHIATILKLAGEKLPCLGLVLSPNILIIGVMGLAM